MLEVLPITDQSHLPTLEFHCYELDSFTASLCLYLHLEDFGLYVYLYVFIWLIAYNNFRVSSFMLRSVAIQLSLAHSQPLLFPTHSFDMFVKS